MKPIQDSSLLPCSNDKVAHHNTIQRQSIYNSHQSTTNKHRNSLGRVHHIFIGKSPKRRSPDLK